MKLPELPESVLSWREGDPITDTHRQALSDILTDFFNWSKETKTSSDNDHFAASDEEIAQYLALAIATQKKMDLKTFTTYFPKTAAEGKGPAVETMFHFLFKKDQQK